MLVKQSHFGESDRMSDRITGMYCKAYSLHPLALCQKKKKPQPYTFTHAQTHKHTHVTLVYMFVRANKTRESCLCQTLSHGKFQLSILQGGPVMPQARACTRQRMSSETEGRKAPSLLICPFSQCL